MSFLHIVVSIFNAISAFSIIVILRVESQPLAALKISFPLLLIPSYVVPLIIRDSPKHKIVSNVPVMALSSDTMILIVESQPLILVNN